MQLLPTLRALQPVTQHGNSVEQMNMSGLMHSTSDKVSVVMRKRWRKFGQCSRVAVTAHALLKILRLFAFKTVCTQCTL